MTAAHSTPLISVVLPTYNGSRYIAESIGSLLRQTYQHFELIVVDGGSLDNTLEIVTAIGDPRIKIVHQPANSGRLPGALNLGFAQATGEYYTWIQDDDYFADNCLEVLAATLQTNPDVDFVYTGYWWIDDQGIITKEFEAGPPEDLYVTNCVGHCFLYRRTIAQKVGDYDTGSLMAEDFEYWVRVYKLGKMRLVPGRYAYHRWHTGSLTVRDYGRYESLRVCARARRKVLNVSWLTYQKQMAAADIEEAFLAHSRHDYGRVRLCLVRSLLRDPGWLSNKGIWSIALESLVGRKLASLVRRHPASHGATG